MATRTFKWMHVCVVILALTHSFTLQSVFFLSKVNMGEKTDKRVATTHVNEEV